MIKKILLLPKTYRIDIFFLVFFLFIYTLFPAGNITQSIMISLFFACVPFNFIYTLNILTDIEEDIINKPQRIKLINYLGFDTILFYSVFLFILGIILPFFFFQRNFFYLSLLVMTGGIFYSLPPFRTKRNILGNIIVLFVGLSILLLGSQSIDIVFLINFFFYAFVMMAFKDINDLKGDRKAKVFNWFNINIPTLKIIFFLDISLIFFNFIFKDWLLMNFSILNLFFMKSDKIKRNFVFVVCFILLLEILWLNLK